MEITLIITGAIAAIAFIGAIVLTILDLKRKKGKEMTKPAITLGLITQHATVASIGESQDEEGLFKVEFKNDDGEILTVSVSEEIREGFEVGLRGELSLTDGLLTSFIPDGFSLDEENA